MDDWQIKSSSTLCPKRGQPHSGHAENPFKNGWPLRRAADKKILPHAFESLRDSNERLGETLLRGTVLSAARLKGQTRFRAEPDGSLASDLIRFFLFAFLVAGLQADAVAEEIESVTAAHTRVVWVQDQSPAQNDTLAHGRQLMLMGLDSRDGRGERSLVASIRNFAKPLFTPDGTRVIYSDHHLDKVFVLDWNSGQRRVVCSGFALEVWADPSDGIEWLYVARRVGSLDDFVYRDIIRVQLDNPKEREPVWSETQVSPDNFQLSADGLRAAGEFPWPNSGLADLTNGGWEKRSSGCWASLAPDNSYVCSVFDGPHRNWQVHSASGDKIWKINLAAPEIFGGYEVFHPRWSNHVRFLTFTGPYKVKGPINEISGGGPEVEVYLAQLSENFDRVERWLRVTNNKRADFYPDVWIEGGGQTHIPESVAGRQQIRTAQPRWPGSDSGLEFVWSSGDQQNQVVEASGQVRSCQIVARALARFDSFYAMHCGAGFFQLDEASQSAAEQLFASEDDFTIEFVLTPIDHLDSDELTCVFDLGDSAGHRVAVVQKQDSLGLMITNQGTARPVKVASLSHQEPRHVVLARSSGKVVCAIDGQVTELPATVNSLAFQPQAARLTFGADRNGEHPWSGRLERVAVFRRTLNHRDFERIAKLAIAEIKDRNEEPRLQVEAELVEATMTPDPQSILPYRRALLVHHFRLRNVLAGESPGDDFLVAQWGVLDGVAVDEKWGGGAVLQPGTVVSLTLQPFDDHPQLTAERQLMEVERIELPIYYDVSFPTETR